MEPNTSRVTSQNQISIPAEIRRRFAIGPGTVLVWEERDGRLEIRPKRHALEDVQQILSHRRVDSLTLEQLDAARRAIGRRHKRGSR